MDGGLSNPAPDSISSVSNWDIGVPPVNRSNWLVLGAPPVIQLTPHTCHNGRYRGYLRGPSRDAGLDRRSHDSAHPGNKPFGEDSRARKDYRKLHVTPADSKLGLPPAALKRSYSARTPHEPNLY